MKNRSAVSKEVQSRLNQGERKETIYTELKGTFGAAAVERSLAQWPYPAAKEGNKHFNYTLLIISSFFAAFTALQLIGLFSSISGKQLAGGVLTLLVQLYMIYGIRNFNLIGYLLVILLGIRTLVGVVSVAAFTPNTMMLLALSVAAIVLAFMQKKRLFPNVSFLMRHKKDDAGNIIF